MAKKLFVSGLTPEATEASLNLLFSQAGKIESIEIVTDKTTGELQGFGFVIMSSDEEANRAISLFDGKLFNGRSIVVYPARPRIVRNPPVKTEDSVSST